MSLIHQPSNVIIVVILSSKYNIKYLLSVLLFCIYIWLLVARKMLAGLWIVSLRTVYIFMTKIFMIKGPST